MSIIPLLIMASLALLALLFLWMLLQAIFALLPVIMVGVLAWLGYRHRACFARWFKDLRDQSFSSGRTPPG